VLGWDCRNIRCWARVRPCFWEVNIYSRPSRSILNEDGCRRLNSCLQRTWVGSAVVPSETRNDTDLDETNTVDDTERNSSSELAASIVVGCP
jgi:hypothetical protein